MLLGLLLLSGLTAGVLTTIGYYTQLYYHSIGFSLAAIGLLLAIPVVPDAIFAAGAPRIMRWLPRRWVLAVFVGAELLGLLALATRVPILALVGYLGLLHVGDSVLYPAISTYLNERSPEAQRATVLSLETGLFSAIMIVLFPLFGFGLTRIDFGVAYLWTFVALLVGSVGIVALVWGLRATEWLWRIIRKTLMAMIGALVLAKARYRLRQRPQRRCPDRDLAEHKRDTLIAKHLNKLRMATHRFEVTGKRRHVRCSA